MKALRVDDLGEGSKAAALFLAGSDVRAVIERIVVADTSWRDDLDIAQIVTGVGFLGAGVILHDHGSVHGLTTAATIWCSAALGSLAGLGYYWETAICTVLVLIVNIAFKKADLWFSTELKKPKEK